MDSTPRPAKKRRKQRKPWYRGATASQMILEHVIRTPITRILLEGVASKRDLLEKLEKHLGGSVSSDDLNLWLKALDYDHVFKNKRLISLPHKDAVFAPHAGENTGPSSGGDDDDSDLDESLPPAMRGALGASTPSAATAFSGVAASGNGMGWDPPKDPTSPAMIDGRPATVIPL